MQSKLADLFYKNASTMPEKLAIWCDGKTKTYKEMAEFVSQISNYLIKFGVHYGDRIAIPMNNSIESVAFFFAAADLGVCLVPLNPTLPFEAIKSAMDFGDVKHLIARKSFFAECQKNGGLTVSGASICLDGQIPNAADFGSVCQMPTLRPRVDSISGDESLILTMTSGSTGNPKPIDISQNNKYERAMAHVRAYGITEKDRILAATPLYHSLAERLVILPLIIGATSILLPRFTPSIWLECARNQSPTFTIAVSAQLAQIVEELKKSNSSSVGSFRCIVSSSAKLEERVKLDLIRLLGCDFHEMYGTSETSTITSICFQREKNKQKSVGLPLAEAKIKILREDAEADFDTECNVGEIGEIACKTKLLCKGYFKQENMMKAQMHEGFFRTGDLGYVDADGYLYFVGRKKEIIITGAVNVYPSDIDAVVGNLPEVKECAAFAYPDDRLGEVVALALVPNDEYQINVRSIRTYCARHLADFQQPHFIFIVDELPKNAMGKLQRSCVYDYVTNYGLKG